MKQILLLTLAFLFLNSCRKNKVVDAATSAEALHSRSVGASANELLSSSRYKSLKVEVQYMTGFAPDAGAISHLQNYLASYLNKPAGITVVTKEVTAAASTTFTVDDVIAFEKTNRTAFSTGEEIAVYILYTNGVYNENNVLGIAYRNTSAAIFGKKIKDNSGGIGQTSRLKLEATVLEHEVGHLLGLVDMGTAMKTPHKDSANGNHCNNQNCLMYYASETTDALGFLITGEIPAPDEACAADLKSNGGK